MTTQKLLPGASQWLGPYGDPRLTLKRTRLFWEGVQKSRPTELARSPMRTEAVFSGRERKSGKKLSTKHSGETTPKCAGGLKTMFGEVWDLEVSRSCRRVWVNVGVQGGFLVSWLGPGWNLRF